MFDAMVHDCPRTPVHPRARAPRIVLYSHDTLGFGHLRRNLLIAGALRRGGLDPQVLMIGGMREAGAFELPAGVDCVTLPAYAKGTDGRYEPRDLGEHLAPLTALRSQVIKAAVLGFDPDLMIVDNVPRGALFELDETLVALRKRGRSKLVLGLRDVIDEPPVVRRHWIRQRNFEAVRRFYDAVWIYGDPSLYDIVAECGLGGCFGTRASYLGYLDHSIRLASPLAAADRDAVAGRNPAPYVLCAVGGGRDGAAVCEAFARASMPAAYRGILVTGTQMPETLRGRVRRLVENRPDMSVVSFVREPIGLMAGASRIIAMGGYNTVCEILSLGRPALVVPRHRPRAEQLIRAERLAARGLISMLHADDLSPHTLEAWLAEPCSSRSCETLDMRGLERAQARAEEMLLVPAATARAC